MKLKRISIGKLKDRRWIEKLDVKDLPERQSMILRRI